MGLPVRDIKDYLGEDLYCYTSEENLSLFMKIRPNYFEDWNGNTYTKLNNREVFNFFSDFSTGQINKIFITSQRDGKQCIQLKQSLERLFTIWDQLVQEPAEEDECQDNYVFIHLIEGLMYFAIDQYLDHIDEGGPVHVHSSRFGTWTSLGGMEEDEPYLVYGGEWEYLHEGKWDDPRENENQLPYMLTTQRVLVGENHQGFALLEPVFLG